MLIEVNDLAEEFGTEVKAGHTSRYRTINANDLGIILLWALSRWPSILCIKIGIAHRTSSCDQFGQMTR